MGDLPNYLDLTHRWDGKKVVSQPRPPSVTATTTARRRGVDDARRLPRTGAVRPSRTPQDSVLRDSVKQIDQNLGLEDQDHCLELLDGLALERGRIEDCFHPRRQRVAPV